MVIQMKKICSVLLIAVLLIGLNSCADTTYKVDFYPELVCYNLYRSDSKNEFSFNMNVTSTQKNPNIEFVSAEGVNTEYLNVTFSNDTFESIVDMKTDGKYVVLLGVHCLTATEYTRIDSIKLLVNENEVEIKFPTPIENSFYNYDKTEHILSQRNMPIYIFPQSFVGRNETIYEFSIEAIDDVTVNSLYFNNFIVFADAEVFVNNDSIGDFKDTFPVNLKQGDVLTIKSKIEFANDKYCGMENLYLNVVADCISNGKAIIEYYPIVATFIGNEDDAKEFMHSYVK